MFEETLTWSEKPLMVNFLLVAVFDKDTVVDDLLGSKQLDLNSLKLEADTETADPVELGLERKNGEAAGKVVLSFSRRAVPEGAFEGILHVAVHRIEGFSDTAGFMDKTDPYVQLVLGKEKRKTRWAMLCDASGLVEGRRESTGILILTRALSSGIWTTRAGMRPSTRS